MRDHLARVIEDVLAATGPEALGSTGPDDQKRHDYIRRLAFERWRNAGELLDANRRSTTRCGREHAWSTAAIQHLAAGAISMPRADSRLEVAPASGRG